MISILLSIVAGYLLGSVPFGLLAGRLRGIDVRQHGSKNIGATNVWRVCGWKVGLPVFLLDVGKGVLAVVIGRRLAGAFGGPLDWCLVASAMACIVGHSFPVWLRFKGGKGVATSLGVIAGMLPIASAIIFSVWGVMLAITRYVSLSSIVAAASFPVAAFFLHASPPLLGFAILSAILVIALHKANIQRLLAGTERRIGAKKEAIS